MNAIWQALTHTPWWVYLLFFYVLKVGFDASKTNVVALKKLFIMPTVLLVMSLNTLLSSVQISGITLSSYALSLLLGVGGGWMLVRKLDLRFDKRRGLVRLPGSWVTLIVILSFFSAKYYFGYSLAIDPTKAEDTTFEIAMLSVSGISTGLFLGRLGCYLIRKKRAPHSDLV